MSADMLTRHYVTFIQVLVQRVVDEMTDSTRNKLIAVKSLAGVVAWIVALLQIAGSGFLLMSVVAQIVQRHLSVGTVILNCVFGLYALIALVAALMLLRGRAWAHTVTTIVQLAQVPVVVTSILTYQLFLGAFIAIYATVSPSFGVFTEWAAIVGKFNFELFKPRDQALVGVNLVPIVLIVCLRQVWKARVVESGTR